MQGPIFQHPYIVIPDNLDGFPDADDQELCALAEKMESSKNCDKCHDSNNREKKLMLKLKGMQSVKRLLQKLNKDKDIELAHCRELLKDAIKEKTKKTMANTVKDAGPAEKDEDIVVEEGIPCTYCSFIAKTMTELKSHFKNLHKFHCDKCDMKFLHRHALNVHMEKHKSSKKVEGYVCSTCKAVHRNLAALKNHEKTHDGEKSAIVQECPLCGFKLER